MYQIIDILNVLGLISRIVFCVRDTGLTYRNKADRCCLVWKIRLHLRRPKPNPVNTSPPSWYPGKVSLLSEHYARLPAEYVEKVVQLRLCNGGGSMDIFHNNFKW